LRLLESNLESVILTDFKKMTTYVPISLKRICAKQLADIEAGKLTRQQAEEIIKHQCRYSSRTREQIIEELTTTYNKDDVEVFRYFGLI
jgi:hypothetical protein